MCIRDSFGGEEFVVIMPDTLPEDAMQIAERLRHSIATAPVSYTHLDVYKRQMLHNGLRLIKPQKKFQ